MKSYIQATLLLVLLFFGTIPIFAQLSDLHYLPPLKEKGAAFTQQLVYLSTPETTAFDVNVYIGTSTTPVTTLSISKSAGATYNPGDGDNNITLLTDANTGSVQSNSGLHFESPSGKKFYVNWRGKSTNQASSLTSKGRNALGTAFKWVGVPNKGTSTTLLSNSLGIMATEDNTTVNIFGYNTNCFFRLGSNETGNTADNLTITLNKGQTYVLEAAVTSTSGPNVDGWLGASITSDNPIAVSFGEMHYQAYAVNNQDCAIDQIMPENAIGKEYIFVRGNGVDNEEFPVIIATQNDTKIYVNGSTTPIATINSGDYYSIPATNYSQSSTSVAVPGANMYVTTSKEAYAVQAVAGAPNTATGDINFIAPVSCLLTNTVDNIADVSNIAGLTITGGITIVASTAINDADITVTYGSNTVSTATLTAAKRTVAGSSEWKTYYLSGLTGNVAVSATGPIAVGYFGYSGNAGVSGYFSGFETIPTIEVERVGDGCLPSSVLTATPGFTAYTWYHDGEVIPGITSNSYAPDIAGKFTVTVTNGTCSYASANQYIYDCNPEIVVTTTADKNGILSGETVNFKVSVLFLGDVNVDNLVVTSVVPPNVTVTGTSATYGTVTNSSSTYTWNIGTMRNGEEELLTITATGNSVASATPGTLNVSKTQTFSLGTEANKVPDDFDETVTVYPALASEPTEQPTGLYFTNTGSAHPYNNVLHFAAAASADGYLVIRKTGGAPDLIPTDGTSYSAGVNGTNQIVYVGNSTTVTDASASPGIDYYYTIYPYKGGGAATNYLTTTPLMGVINNQAADNLSMSSISQSSSAGLADEGVNVTFIDGLPTGTTVTAAKFIGGRPADYTQGLPAGLNSVDTIYYTVSSSTPNPGNYVISLDFSLLGISDADWSSTHVLKRSNSSSNWEDITGNVIDTKTDGLTGKLTITGLSSFSDFGIGSTQIVLPLAWVDFSAKLQGSSVLLQWKTGSEQNTKDFLVEYSMNGTDWKQIGTEAAAGNSNTTLSYSFVHTTPIDGANYYRIMQRDIDGRFSYSPVRIVVISKNINQLAILGNPVINGMLELNAADKMMVSIKSIDGKTLLTKQLVPGRNEVDVQFMAAGTYLLVGNRQTLKFIKK